MRYIYSLILVAIAWGIEAQVTESPLSHLPTLERAAARLPVLSTRDSDDTLSLPFIDDFSYLGPYPSSEKWCTYSTFVNHTMAFQPPSIGVATFDGLAQNGSPYLSNGAGDTLTSLCFYLDGFSTSDNVYLSFHYQPQGLGDRPETGDSLILEFKNMDEQWVVMEQWEGFSSSDPTNIIPQFIFYTKAIPQIYLYDGFQFRLRNKTSGLGQVDLWHLDYVRLTSASAPGNNFNDVAFTQPPSTFLAQYTAMPWRHFAGFEANELSDSYTLGFYSQFQDIQEIQNREASIVEVTTNTVALQGSYLTDTDPPIPFGNVAPGSHIQATKTWNTSIFDNFVNTLSNAFSQNGEYVFVSQFSYTQTGQNPAFPSTFDNDMVRRETRFGNEFAYDDGTAESNVKAQNPGTDVVVKYRLNIPDSLRAIRMHIPHVFDDASTQLFNIKVFTSLDQEPIYEDNFQSPIYADEFANNDTLQGFTTYTIKDEFGQDIAIYLPAGDFYIGWEQVTDTETPIPIGFDKNNPAAGVNNYFDTGNGFEPFPNNLQGAIMIRPVLGNEPATTTSNGFVPAQQRFRIYPNPAQEILVLETQDSGIRDGHIRIFDLAGKEAWSSAFQSHIPVADFHPGMYVLVITDHTSGQQYQEKVIIR